MLDPILQQFASGDTESVPHEQAISHVSRMMEQAPQEHTLGALSDALSGMSSSAFGSSVASATQGANQEQRGQLGSMLMGALGGGGSSSGSILNNLGISSINPSEFSPQDLGSLASHLHQNNPSALTGLLGAALGGGNLGGTSMGGLGGAGGGGFSGGSGAGLLSLLGNPVVRQVGANLAQRLLSGGRSSL